MVFYSNKIFFRIFPKTIVRRNPLWERVLEQQAIRNKQAAMAMKETKAAKQSLLIANCSLLFSSFYFLHYAAEGNKLVTPSIIRPLPHFRSMQLNVAVVVGF